MATRTTSVLVIDTLQQDYGPAPDGSLPSLTTYISTASTIVDRVVSIAGDKGYTLTTTELELIERWLAAHAYAQMDKPLASKSSGGASGSFQGQTAKGFESTLYGQMALRLDWTGALTIIDKRQTVDFFWAGRLPRNQTDYDSR